MKNLNSKTPYLILLVIFLCIAVADSLVWSEQVDPVIVEINEAGETPEIATESNKKFVLQNAVD